ncbi:MAG: CADD family putative folate metabolism protein [Bdellovibrionota bacterium]
MSFSQRIQEAIESFHLLSHPFYQAWNKGELSSETLQYYASQYYHHVKAFPRYISATHSKCEDPQARKILLENLMDEEGAQGQPHPELWMQFATALGCNEKEVEKTQEDEIKEVIETFFSQSNASYERGLAALYAYEYQVPEVATTKIEGLKKHYNVSSKEGLSFFEVHKEADVYHRQACESILDNIPEDKQPQALEAAQQAGRALWNFLTKVYMRQILPS